MSEDNPNPRTMRPETRPEAATEPLVLLVVPPFQGLRCPALGASQLKADLLAHGIRAEMLYLNLRFGDRILPRVHDWLSGTGKALLGEFVFSCAVHDKDEEEIRSYFEQIIQGSEYEKALDGWFPELGAYAALTHLIAEAKDFVSGEAIDAVLERDPWMVGFSSTFQSNCCSLAVIREIKRRRPDILTVIGGANCEGPQGEELIARYEEIDFVGRGECDLTFPEMVKTLLAGESGAGKTGFLSREMPLNCPSPPLNGEELDGLPYPDFYDYFEQLERVSYRDRIAPGLAMETSRGCWWGMKQHCTFCAFNREGMAFRAKSARRVADEMEALVERHGLRRMELTDNILDMGYFKTLLPLLAESPIGEYFWETKSNLSRDQIRLMRQAGIRWIQPGLESLSDETLRLMKKGTTQVQNSQTLKWCEEHGIFVSWNWLFGFPGEKEVELEELEEVAKAAHHLQPPQAAPVLFLERFSPYHMTPEEWNLEPIWPCRAYGHVYPFEEEALDRLAFFFDCDFLLEKERGEGFARLQEIVAEWRQAFAYSHLLMVPSRKSLVLVDTRRGASRWVRRLRGIEREIYEFCWRMRSRQDLERLLDGRVEPDRIDDIVASFIADRLMIENANRYLSLAIDPRFGYRDYPAVFPGGQMVVESDRPAERRRWLVDGLLLRRPLRETAAEIRRRLRIALTDRAIGLLLRWLPEPEPRDAGVSEAASQAA